MSVPSKARKSRFYHDIFEGNVFVAYKDSKKCCKKCITRGDTLRLPTFSDPDRQVYGKVRFISVHHAITFP